jgi:hypothetical protein
VTGTASSTSTLLGTVSQTSDSAAPVVLPSEKSNAIQSSVYPDEKQKPKDTSVEEKELV